MTKSNEVKKINQHKKTVCNTLILKQVKKVEKIIALDFDRITYDRSRFCKTCFYFIITALLYFKHLLQGIICRRKLIIIDCKVFESATIGVTMLNCSKC